MKSVIAGIIPILLIASCQKNQDSQVNEASLFEAERTTFFNTLKNPEEVAKLIPGLTGFNASLLNDPANFYLYSTNEVKAAANLGVYIADLNYCILYHKSNESGKYFNATYELSKIIRVEKNTLEFLMKRYEQNLTHNDSVKLIVQHLLEKSTLGLQGTDRERLAGIAIASYQMENLHLALATINSYPATLTADQMKSKDLLFNFIIDQRGNFEVIYNFIRTNSDPLDPDRNPNYPYFDNALRELLGVYNKVTPDDPQLNELSIKVNAIRDKIISAE
jgi:hypothetical protein